MPPTLTDEGLTAARVIHRRWPDVGVLVLSTYVDTAFATELITRTQRSVGYLLKDRVQDTDELVDALDPPERSRRSAAFAGSARWRRPEEHTPELHSPT